MLLLPTNLIELNALMANKYDHEDGAFATSGYFSTIDNVDDWSRITRVSMLEGKILGYFKATVDRHSNVIGNIATMCFEEKEFMTYLKDLRKFLELLLRQFRKVCFSCYESNAKALKVWKKITKEYKGRYIGYYENDALINGKYENAHFFEILNKTGE